MCTAWQPVVKHCRTSSAVVASWQGDICPSQYNQWQPAIQFKQTEMRCAVLDNRLSSTLEPVLDLLWWQVGRVTHAQVNVNRSHCKGMHLGVFPAAQWRWWTTKLLVLPHDSCLYGIISTLSPSASMRSSNWWCKWRASPSHHLIICTYLSPTTTACACKHSLHTCVSYATVQCITYVQHNTTICMCIIHV